ncbi:[citrate (pro-3S)-lyase] ligase [Anaerovirgula multivorans]|uniref:[Citrate [pro-3S]-lyase] ligase n=1 Tax=Anaerovirgula multivorans TaxID=312168 RepID=A0A239K9E6_9FIRM|nr:[citrate (pro-3S)-lyase] ligase [Anaerovirgula multivorans]SNT14263.1 [citrate (pro-3S)-lyase] ligase [Anaerovirgula multivorans]
MEYFLQEKIVDLRNHRERMEVENFLRKYGLMLEKDVEYTVALLYKERFIATGSLSKRILKCIAVNPEYQGMGISTKIISHLVNEAYYRGNTHLFIYTNSENAYLFTDVGFHKIAEITGKVCLLENKRHGLESFVASLKETSAAKQKNNNIKGDKVAALVMNCNPFTLGHQYIIERAAAESESVHIFIVWENRSSFPPEVRYHLAKEGTKHLSNVILHKGIDYIISNATFPSYFLKEDKTIVRVHALLDLEIFKTFIAPALNIKKRYIGEEPYCPVTKIYNETMKEVLPSSGITVKELKRLSVEEVWVSASKVRKFIMTGEIEKAKSMVPQSTYEFLLSEEGQQIIRRMNVLGEKEKRR